MPTVKNTAGTITTVMSTDLNSMANNSMCFPQPLQ